MPESVTSMLTKDAYLSYFPREYYFLCTGCEMICSIKYAMFIEHDPN